MLLLTTVHVGLCSGDEMYQTARRSVGLFQLSLASLLTHTHTEHTTLFSVAAHPAQRGHLQATSSSENLQLESRRDYRPSEPLTRQRQRRLLQDRSRV